MPPESAETSDKQLFTVEELAEKMKEAIIAMGGEEMAELHNDWFPAEPVKYCGDSVFEEE